MKVGDLVEVQTKFHGKKFGVVERAWDVDVLRPTWLIYVTDHWTDSVIADESDLRVINESR